MATVIGLDNISDAELELAVRNKASEDPNRRIVILTEEEYNSGAKAPAAPFVPPPSAPEPVVEEHDAVDDHHTW